MRWPGDGSLIATCGGGAEEALELELREMGLVPLDRGNGIVTFRGAEREMIEANLRLRCASRILIPLFGGPVRSYADLYRLARRVPWQHLVPARLTIAVSAITRESALADSRLAALKVKDAIVDTQRRSGQRSNVNRTRPDAPVSVHIAGGIATISLDSSGDPLHERGYRTEAGDAPLRETVAAAMLRTSGWDTERPLLDPFCGSGTIAIEAALLAARIPPGAIRTGYAFSRWPWISPHAADDRLHALAADRGDRPAVPLVARDIDPQVIEIARRNARRAGVERLIHFEVADALHQDPPAGTGLVVTNPPYGERTDIGSAREFYGAFGDRLKQSYGGWQAWILSANRDALKGLGLRIASRRLLWNGGLEARLCRVDVFSATCRSARGERQ